MQATIRLRRRDTAMVEKCSGLLRTSCFSMSSSTSTPGREGKPLRRQCVPLALLYWTPAYRWDPAASSEICRCCCPCCCRPHQLWSLQTCCVGSGPATPGWVAAAASEAQNGVCGEGRPLGPGHRRSVRIAVLCLAGSSPWYHGTYVPISPRTAYSKAACEASSHLRGGNCLGAMPCN